MAKKQIIGGPLEINGRVLSLSRAIRAGDFVFLTGQIPMRNGAPMTDGSIQEQTRVVLDDITETLATADCTREDVVKAMVWLRVVLISLDLTKYTANIFQLNLQHAQLL